MRTVCLFVLLCVSALSYGAKKYKLVEISTNLGNIKIRLYENIPRHSENFLKLVKAHHYDRAVLPIHGMLRKKRQ